MTEEETLTLGAFQERLGVSPAFIASRKDIREWLEKQDGVMKKHARHISIPASLVETTREHFNITPRKGRKARAGADLDYTVMSVSDLLEHRGKEDTAVKNFEAVKEQVKTLRKNLAEVEAQLEAGKGASGRLAAIDKTLSGKQAELEEEQKRIAREQALLKKLSK